MEQIRKIIENFESGLVSAGVIVGDIDYDILAEVRQKCWADLEELLTKK